MGIEQYVGRVAMVNGASWGIGAAITQALLRAGIHVAGFDRSLDTINALHIPGAPGNLHAVAGDILNETDVINAVKWVRLNLGGADILINCLGAISNQDLSMADASEWRQVFGINVIGLSTCIREALNDMRDRKVDDGYIITISSMAAHTTPLLPSKAIYYASKYAVKSLNDSLRRELSARNSKIRNATISPGAVKMERPGGEKSYDNKSLDMVTYMETQDIADMVIFILSQPQRVQIQDIRVSPTGTTYY